MYLLNLVMPGCKTLYHHNNEANLGNYKYNHRIYTFANFRIEPVDNPSNLETYDAVLVRESTKEVREELTQVGGGLVAEIINVYDNGVHVLVERYQVAGYINVLDEIRLKLQNPTRMITNSTIPTKHFNT
ncbi:hypothetical protein H6F98_11755 [Microcoleus sp. FACHB-SPT15]|uniref:hypothetical protein n=1 Tax=Microcoleus sp. FACHB-SPT15 TaxID=2692830 RepID=UPI001783DD0B|nr:hypothetical protein [Microcoleus sp. FACHB-SPT15]MBD1806122.1 hypothetical protein [Microcoleus sp. FACHB-SPT15]